MSRSLILILCVVCTAGPVAADCGPGSKKASRLFDQGLSMYRGGQPSLALRFLKQAIEADEDYIDPYLLSAEIHRQAGRLEKAADLLAEIQSYCPDTEPMVDRELGLAYFDMYRFEEAADALRRFVELGDAGDEELALLARCEFLVGAMDNPVPFDPQPLMQISTEADEYLPVISPDNEIFLFTRRHRREDRFSVIGHTWVEDFCISRAGEQREFPVGEALTAPFNLGENEGGASLSIDNREMYVTVCNSPQGYGSCDLYRSEFVGDSWQPMVNLGPEINDSLWQSQVSLSSDGQRLYFASDSKGGMGGKDIYYCSRQVDGGWSAPVNCGPKVNSAFDEKSPFIHPDNNTLYFSSTREPGMGGFDILYARADGSEGWKDAVNIGFPINSEADDLGFFVSTDGNTGYFASNKLAGVGGWDIYNFPLYEGARPKPVLFAKGRVLDEEGQVVPGARMEVKNSKTDEVMQVPVDSATGAFVFAQLFEEDQVVSVFRKGYFVDTELFRADDPAAASPSTVSFTLPKLKTGAVFRIAVLFDTDKADLKPTYLPQLNDLVRFMEVNERVQVEVAGHTDAIGDDESNKRLSGERARAVREYMTDAGIDEGRIRYRGYGEDEPVDSNETESGRARNRRTEVRVIGNL